MMSCRRRYDIMLLLGSNLSIILIRIILTDKRHHSGEEVVH